ncbi:hypothetical protein RA280_14160 [Cupriavidus sp. CV2]|uniref:hypothetical protein n=1 Tax=Cupriavidus ulmosensis TaxID=3065913 RepID=UPI00296ABEE8|nr:hypothetical protein [Cupriavidus sp. CV2]MDW3682870.1 hypothetical protein [Cupriavidus sp. CV2]
MRIRSLTTGLALSALLAGCATVPAYDAYGNAVTEEPAYATYPYEPYYVYWPR